jgi:hypothetical protein
MGYEIEREETYWEKYGPDDTAKPEPTQHALESGRSFLFPGGRPLHDADSGTVRFLDFKIPDHLKNALPGQYTVRADEVYDVPDRYVDHKTGEVKMIEKETADALERRAGEMLERAAEMRAKYERFGKDDFPDRAVIIFDKRFDRYNGRELGFWSKPYFYAAIKADGLWSTTGPRAPKSYTWDELIKWMGDGVEEIFYVNEMTKFVG